jgi:NAD(P)-dependent dehydrogenase (short-subunit alcohol dehydrogenase family)
MERLGNQVAIVTGGATGIGRAVVELFAKEGAAVVLADVNETEGQRVADAVLAEGGRCRFVRCDVSQAKDVEAAVDEAVRHFGKLTVAVLNAGIDVVGTVVESSEEDWWRCLRVNLGGVFLGMKYAIPQMRKAGSGSIVATASIQALLGFRAYAAYAAAKGGIIGLVHQVAVDYGGDQIRVNAICPSTVLTPMCDPELTAATDPKALIQSWAAPHPLGRIGTPEDIAQAALYLASSESSWVTGQAFAIDGGVTIRGFH